MKNFYTFLLLVILPAAGFAQFTTPNENQAYTLDDLVTLSGGTITFDDGAYQINDNLIVSITDTLKINEDVVVRVAENALITIGGGFYVNSNTLFTKIDTTYKGFKFEEGSVVYLEGATFEYGGGFKANSGDLTMIDCIMRYQTRKTGTSGAVSLATGKPYFYNCTFLENERSGISSPLNKDVAPSIINCTFTRNSTEDNKRPQINLGRSGVDTTFIINNVIIGNVEYTKVGGIAFMSTSDNHAVISGNVIRDNMFGISSNGSGHTRIIGNIIEDNNKTEGPMAGGSGINILGGGDMGHVILDNEIRGNLWGITTQGNGKLNMGDLDDEEVGRGGNIFSNNGNGGVIYAFYNNTPHNALAQGNCWIEENPEATEEEVAAVIFDQADDETLGIVDYSHFTCDFSMPCDAPTDLEAGNINITSALISWNAPSTAPANGYEYFYATDNQEPTEAGTQTEDTSIALTDLSANTTYYFWVRSDCGDNFSEWAGPESFVTLSLPCVAPTDLAADNITFSTAEISWNAPSSAPDNGYEYFYATDNQEPTEAGTHTDDSSVILTELTGNTTYYFWVRSDCGNDFSGWAGPESFMTDETSSVSEVSLDQIAKIYPNPTTGILNINLSNESAETIAIYDLSGRVLELVNLTQTHDITLDLSEYAAGVYLIQISGSDFIANGKFVIQ